MKLSLLSTVLIAPLLAAICHAQAPPKDLSEASLEELMNIRVYSASKYLQSESEAPSAVTVVTAQEIKKYGYRTLAEVLQSVGDFYITYDRNYTYVGVRGFGRLGDWNSRVLVLVDGHRINNNVFGDAFIGSEFLVDTDMIEQVEVVRGASSSLYGSHAFFAVINVITRKADRLKGIEVSVEPGSLGYKERITYGGSYKGVDTVLSGSFYDSPGQKLFFPEFNNAANNFGITRNTDDESYRHFLATISYRGFTLQGVYTSREKGDPIAYFGGIFNDAGTRNFDYQQYFDLTYHHSLGEGWNLSTRSAYDQSRGVGPVVYTPGHPDIFTERGNWWTNEGTLNRTLFRKHKVTFGSEVIDHLRQDQGDYTFAVNTYLVRHDQSLIWALYGEDEFAVTRKLTLTGGLRYDHYDDFGGTANPRVGIIYRPKRGTTLKILYGSAFRAPQVFESHPNFGPFFAYNDRLQPETIRSLEGVIEQSLSRNVQISGSVFRNSIDHLISLQPAENSPLFIYQNSDKANDTGVDLGISARTARGIEGRASYSYNDANNATTHQNLSNSPRQLAKIDISVPLVLNRIFASVDAQHTSATQTLAGQTLSGFSVINATMLGEKIGRHFDLSASIYNLLDKKYFNPGRPEDSEDSLQQDGRNFRVKVTVKF